MNLRLLDLEVAVECDDAAMAKLVADLWGPFLVFDAVVDSEPQIKVRITGGNGSPFAISVDEKMLVDHTDSPWDVVLALRPALDDLVLSHLGDAIDFHAAAIARGDHIVLLPGDPGAGKTTLVLAALKRDWELLCDDFALSDPERGGIIPMARPIGVRRHVPLTAFENRWVPPHSVPQPPGNYLVPASAFALRLVSQPITPTHIVFPRFASTNVVEELSLGGAVARLGRHIRPLDGRALSALTVLCEGATGRFSLDYDDPAAACDWLEEMLVSNAPRN